MDKRNLDHNLLTGAFHFILVLRAEQNWCLYAFDMELPYS